MERRIRNHPRTEQILLRFPQAQIVEIEHYKDVFNRHGQDCVRQHQAQALILAEKTDHFFYEGAPVCQDFGNTNFYYCSTMMNCIYDCSYCYLKGMYPSGHMVLFVNIEDYLEELDHILKTQNMYVCISYDADLLAMEAVTGYVRLWSAYAAHPYSCFLNLRNTVAPYLSSLPYGSRKFYEDEIQEIYIKLNINDKKINRPLDPEYLMGFYLERDALETYRENKTDPSERNETNENGQ